MMDKNKKYVLVTGSAGLIGGQSVDFFIKKGYHVIGIDNDMRSYFFGENASTKKTKDFYVEKYDEYIHLNNDIRDFQNIEKIFKEYCDFIEIIVHTAAQPSHDWASKEPLTDFTINANGTLNLLELTRIYCPKATFIFTSTNKVYGDRPNNLKLKELDSRWEIDIEYYRQKNGNEYINYGVSPNGSINELMSIDNTKHSLFGASKVSADIMCQEYGKYFGMNVGVFRGGCLTGPNHAGAELHGFLSYLVKCIIHNKPYVIYGYKGKQVRDNIHSWDLVNMFWHFHQNPKQGEVYNVGGGRDNSVSILEAINIINSYNNSNWKNYVISNNNRIGDHIWYISDINKFKNDYPEWNLKYYLNDTLKEMIIWENNTI